MLDAVPIVYETLFQAIQTESMNKVRKLDRGYWFREECSNSPEEFPYAFLEQPEATSVVLEKHPSVFTYNITISLFILTYKDDQTQLFFSRDPNPEARGAVELVLDIGGAIFQTYKFGLPYQPRPQGWNVLEWTLGAMRRPRLTELANYLDNDHTAGAEIEFVFTIIEDGPQLRRR